MFCCQINMHKIINCYNLYVKSQLKWRKSNLRKIFLIINSIPAFILLGTNNIPSECIGMGIGFKLSNLYSLGTWKSLLSLNFLLMNQMNLPILWYNKLILSSHQIASFLHWTYKKINFIWINNIIFEFTRNQK